MTRTKIAALMAVASLAAFTTACGDDEKDETTTTSQTTGTTAAAEDIVATALATSDLSTLASAVEAAGLVETLQGEGPFTVFAPTNDAFDALGADTLETLTTSEKGKADLKEILLNHTVSGKVMAADLSDGQEVETVGGKKLTVKIDGDKVMIGDATVAQPDVETSNGVVHVIDTVLQ